MLSRRHELRGSWWRYVVCRSYEAPQYDGRVLPGHEAKRVVAELLASGDAQQVRALYADLTGSCDLRRVSNHDVGRWFSDELGCSARGSRVAGLILVKVPLFGRLLHHLSEEPASARRGPSEAERLVNALEAALGKSDLVHANGGFRLVVAGAKHMPGRDRYEALGAAQAKRLLQAMAQDPRLAESVRELLKKAAVLITPGQNGQSKEQLVLLQRYRPAGPAEKPAEPPMTPAQVAKAREPKQRSYIVVEIYSDKGAPIPGVLLELAAPDGTITKLSTDELGEAGLRNIDAGSYRVKLVDPP